MFLLLVDSVRTIFEADDYWDVNSQVRGNTKDFADIFAVLFDGRSHLLSG